MRRDRARRSAGFFLAALVLASPVADRAAAQTLDSISANIQIFAMICATSIGFNQNDTRACGQSVFDSSPPLDQLGGDAETEADRKPILTIESLLANALAGSIGARSILRAHFTENIAVPYVRLNVDPCDGFLSNGDGTCSAITGRAPLAPYTIGVDTSLNETLTDEQEALLGCGPYWGTDCEIDGIDLLNAEMSVLMQSWPDFEAGFVGYAIGAFDANGNPLPVPGTVGFDGSIPGSRWYNNATVLLPGARGPADPGYDADIEGCTDPGPAYCDDANPLVIPIITGPQQPHDFGPAAGLPFQSEMAALSWNFLMTLVAFSSVPSPIGTSPTDPDPSQFAPNDPMSRTPGQCSFVQPQYCASVQAFFQLPEPDGALLGAAACAVLALLGSRARRD